METDILPADEEKPVDVVDEGSAVGFKPLAPESRGWTFSDAALIGLGLLRRFKMAILCVLGGIAAIFFVWLIWFYLIATHEDTMKVDSFSWERKIEVLRYKVVHDSSWYTHPSDAYNVDGCYCYHYSHEVYDHTEHYDCGTADHPQTCSRRVYRKESVYDWYYDYDINRWRYSRDIVTSGSDQNPYWDDLSDEHFDSRDVLGNEQLSGHREETYKVFLLDRKEKKHTKEVSLTTFLDQVKDQWLTIHITRSGNIRSVDWNVPTAVSTTT